MNSPISTPESPAESPRALSIPETHEILPTENNQCVCPSSKLALLEHCSEKTCSSMKCDQHSIRQDEHIERSINMSNQVCDDLTDSSSDEQPFNQQEFIINELREENESLREQVIDLNGALIARDLELGNLSERYDILRQAVEQQDQVIAEIYAAASPSMESFEKYSCLRESAMEASCKKEEDLADSLDSLRNLKKNNNASTDSTDPAQTMLRSHLDSMGFHSTKINFVLHDLSYGVDGDTSSRREAEMLNQALDKLLVHVNDGKQDDELYHVVSIEDENSLSHRDSFKLSGDSSWNTRESMGFLKSSIRKNSARLSVTDFGLLSDSDDDEMDEGASAASHQVHDDTSSPNKLKKLVRKASKTLFAGIKDEDPAKHSAEKKKKEAKTLDEGDDLSYPEFLERLSLPASADILHSIRRFVGSVLGPRGDGSPPTRRDSVDYTFYGHRALQTRCQQFFEEMENTLAKHPAWSYASERTLRNSRDGIEKYVMEKLESFSMKYTDGCDQWRESDQRILERMELLSFVTPDMLDVKSCLRNEVVWSIAEDELRKINTFKSPGDKINCIVRCCSILFSVLNLCRGDISNRPGADDFLPVFIFVVLKSKISNLYSNCEYIAAYRNKDDLMTKAGYCLVNLRSALEFISVMDATMLTVDRDEFNRKLREEEERIKARKALERK